VCFVVLHSSQDHLRIGACDLDHPISCRCKETMIVGMPGRGICRVLSFYTVPMVPSSSISIIAGGERLQCNGFSLSEPVRLGNFKFIANYFSGLTMVPSSSIAITAGGERLACGGFSFGEPIHLGNFEFIANYFSGLSLPPRRGNEGTVFVVSTHSVVSTL
jgi:hypothetical protein